MPYTCWAGLDNTQQFWTWTSLMLCIGIKACTFSALPVTDTMLLSYGESHVLRRLFSHVT